MKKDSLVLKSAVLARRGFMAKAAGLSAMVWASGAPALAPHNALKRPADVTPRALGAFLLDLTLAGSRLVAVGERGTVLLSDDAGASWRQVPCPVSVTLTAVEFVTPQLGWAVGHAGVVLHSRDAGSTWIVQLDGVLAAALELESAKASGNASRLARAQQLVDDGADKPLLALHFDATGRRGLAIGAYGSAYATQDGGASWASWIGHLDNPKSLHLNALRVIGQRVYLAGEQGLLLRSDDAGEQFTRLPSPYAGSWFALTGMGDDLLIAAGLRGNAWYSEDRGATFQKSAQPLPISFTSALRDPTSGKADSPLMLVNQAGMVLASADRGRSWRPLPLPPGPPLTRIALAGDGALVAASMAGAKRLPTGPAAGQPAPAAAATSR